VVAKYKVVIIILKCNLFPPIIYLKNDHVAYHKGVRYAKYYSSFIAGILLQINFIRLHIGKLIKFDSMCITLKGKHVHNGRQTKYRWTGEHKNKWGDNSHGIWLGELDTYRHVKTNTYSWPNLQSIIYVVHDGTNEPVLVNI